MLSHPISPLGHTAAQEVGRAGITIPLVHKTTLSSPRLSVWPEAAEEVAKPGAAPGFLAPGLPLRPAWNNFHQVRPLGPVGIFPL